MNCFLHGNGSGTASLNFRVLGGATQPENPRENDIWVQTDTAFFSWAFSATEPAGTEGAVWISVGMESQVAFSAVKKNTLWVYPVEVKEYRFGGWEARNACCFQNGRWVVFSQVVTDVRLFDQGDPCEGITGGWGVIGRGEVKADSLSLYVYHDANGAQVYTQRAVKLTDFSKLRVVLSGSTVGIYVGVMSSAPDMANQSFVSNRDKCASRMTIAAGTLTQELDISGLSGEYYVWAGRGGSSVVTDNVAYITEVILMK